MLNSISLDYITLVVSALLLLFALTTPWLNGFFHKPEIPEDSEDTSSPEDAERTGPLGNSNHSGVPLSIILTPYKNAYELEHNLPLLLQQDYPAGYEVIVVVWKGDSETEDVLKRFADDPHLYTTYVPDSSRYMSRKKLGITLGVKAAKNDWFVLTDIVCQPASTQWLSRMAQHCDDKHDIVIGYTAYDDATSAYRRFERTHTNLYLLHEDMKGTPYRHNGSNLLVRKSVFLDGDGFRGNLKYIRGEYDFTVNKYATSNNTAVELHPDSWMIEQEPADKTWLSKHLFYMESRRHLSRSWRHRARYNLDQWALHLNYLLIVAALAFSIITERWLLTVVACIALLLTLILRTHIALQTLRMLREDISWWKIVPFEISLFWHHVGYLRHYHRANKTDFISHKI